MNITASITQVFRGEGQGPAGGDGETAVFEGTWTPTGGGQSFPAEVTVKYAGLGTSDELEYGDNPTVVIN